MDGEVFADTTWKACQDRTHGVSFALNKKVRNESECRKILADWGLLGGGSDPAGDLPEAEDDCRLPGAMLSPCFVERGQRVGAIRRSPTREWHVNLDQYEGDAVVTVRLVDVQGDQWRPVGSQVASIQPDELRPAAAALIRAAEACEQARDANLPF